MSGAGGRCILLELGECAGLAATAAAVSSAMLLDTRMKVELL